MLDSPAFVDKSVTLLSELTNELDQLFALKKSSEEILDEAASIVSAFDNDGMCAHMAYLLGQDTLLEQVAKRSYLHGNGFYKILLFKNELYTMRLHIWLPSHNSQENLHGHCWPFVSKILVGEVKSEIWADCIDKYSANYDEYHYQGKDCELRYVGKARVRLKQVMKLKEGTPYVMYPDALHRIINEGGAMSATLMVRPNNTRSWARNIIVNDLIPDVKPDYMDAAQLRDLFRCYTAYSNGVVPKRESSHQLEEEV